MTKLEKTLVCMLVITGLLAVFYFKGLVAQNELWAAEDREQAILNKIYIDAFGNLGLEGRSAIVFDSAKDKSLFSMHENSVRPIASITKVMTAIVGIEAMPAGTIVSIPKAALSEEGDSGLYLGEKWALKDLASFMLVVSSNDAAKAVAISRSEDFSSFIEEMNKKTADLELTKTNFSNETGLDLDKKTAGAYSSARDVAKLISYGYLNHKDLFQVTSNPEITLVSESGLKHTVKNTDNLVGSLPNILASKTGYTDLAGGNLAVVFQTPSGRLLSAVVLGSTIDGRFRDIEKLINASSRYVNDIIRYEDGKYPI